MRRFALLLLLCANSAGIAHAGLFSDDEAQKKIAELQQKNSALQQQVQTLEARLAKLEPRIAESESALKNLGIVELLSQIESLKGELAKLRGQDEVQAHDIETTQKRQKDLYVDLDTRLRGLEHASAPAAATVPPDAGAAAANPADTAAETKSYNAALDLFRLGNYQGAIAALQTFIASYPKGTLASSAQYWIGNAYFALRDFKAALAAQQKLLSLYPASQKVPDALLNMASSQLELNDTAAARKTLEELVAKHPLSNAAELAKKRLGNIK
jgi:tol-pal system protein YbgF